MKDTLALFVATLGIGKYLKMAATTSGIIYLPFTVISVTLARLIVWGPLFFILFMGGVFLLGMWAVPRAEKVLGSQVDPRGNTRTRDQNQIVIDELLGMLVAVFPLVFVYDLSLWYFIIAFVLFRFFDIFKKFALGASYFDNVKTSLGVMLDDVAAGFWAGVVTYILVVLI